MGHLLLILPDALPLHFSQFPGRIQVEEHCDELFRLKKLSPQPKLPVRQESGPQRGGVLLLLFVCSGGSDSLRPHGLQHSRPPCPSPTPRGYSNSCPLSRRCHPAISFSVLPFSSCPQPCPASGSFLKSQFFPSDGQRIRVSASVSILPMNIRDRSPLEWTGWISLQSSKLSGVFSSTTVQKHQSFSAQLSLWSNSHIHTWLPEKPQLWPYRSLSESNVSAF